MPVTLLPNGSMRVQEPSRLTLENGNSWRSRLFGLVMISISIASWCYNWHLVATKGHFYGKLSLLASGGLFGGLLMLLSPELAGPLRTDSPRSHKVALGGVIALMAVVSGIDMYSLYHATSPRKTTITPWSSSMGVPSFDVAPPASRVPAKVMAPDILFLGRSYHLASFSQNEKPMWEYITADETVNDWKTLLTFINRPDASTREDLDRLAEGIMTRYKSRGGQILTAKTVQERSGAVFNYMVAAFEEPDKQRFELNFVKVALGSENAVVVIYGVRITDPRDYVSKAKGFLTRNSGEIGRALGQAPLPDLNKLPQR
jgi:hypothetical protein